jgi:hypothetical protein
LNMHRTLYLQDVIESYGAILPAKRECLHNPSGFRMGIGTGAGKRRRETLSG